MWTGDRVLVFGLNNYRYGHLYDVASDSWSLPDGGIAFGTIYHQVGVWTGLEAILWGRGAIATFQYNPRPGRVVFTATDGMSSATSVLLELTITGFPPVDVDQGGTVDVVDVQVCVNIVLGTPRTYITQGDVNEDGFVDIIDIQKIVNCILAVGSCD